jgi:multiple sugar transport system ATP-binding protein
MGFLNIQNVKKSFGDTEVLTGIDLAIEEGEFLVLVGPSGCGKSTLLSLVAGLEELSDGGISIRNTDVSALHPSKRNIAMVFQSYALYPHLSVRQNMGFALEMQGINKNTRNEKVETTAELLQLTSLLDRKPSALSGGQRQRVAMGRALVREPDVFLFDEPLSNLDAKLRVEMRTLIKRLHQNLKVTTVYVTHDQIEAMTLADRIAVMNAGEIQQLGTPKEIYEQPVNAFVAKFMGSPSMNLLKVKVVNTEQGPGVELPLENSTSILPMAHLKNLGAYLDKEVILGLRPELVSSPDGDIETGEAGKSHYFENRVDVVEPTGADIYLVSEIAGAEVVSRISAELQVEAGSIFRFAIKPGLALAFDSQTELGIL